MATHQSQAAADDDFRMTPRLSVEALVGNVVRLWCEIRGILQEVPHEEIVAVTNYWRLNLWVLHPDRFNDMPVETGHWRDAESGPKPSERACLERALRDMLPAGSCGTHRFDEGVGELPECEKCFLLALWNIGIAHQWMRVNLAIADRDGIRWPHPVQDLIHDAVRPFIPPTETKDAAEAYILRHHLMGQIFGDDAAPANAEFLRIATPGILKSPTWRSAAQKATAALRRRAGGSVTRDDIESAMNEKLFSTNPQLPLGFVKFDDFKTMIGIGKSAGALSAHSIRDAFEKAREIPSHKPGPRESDAPDIDTIDPRTDIESIAEAREERQLIDLLRSEYAVQGDRAALAAIDYALTRRDATQEEIAKSHGVSIDQLAYALKTRVQPALRKILE